MIFCISAFRPIIAWLQKLQTRHKNTEETVLSHLTTIDHSQNPFSIPQYPAHHPNVTFRGVDREEKDDALQICSRSEDIVEYTILHTLHCER